MWSLRARESDSLLTPHRGERDGLVAGGVWRELCSPFGDWLPFCRGGSDSVKGATPFYVSRWPVGPTLYRCIGAGGRHFVSTAASCEGQRVEGPIGFVAAGPSIELPRPLFRCRNPATGLFSHSLLGGCPSGEDAMLLGYVR
jgi:hypothetical protein